MSAPPVQAPAPLVLAGPTASGKTALALHLARRWPLEVISMDSALVYCGMDIGTAKPDAAERAAVSHHLIDTVEPTGSTSAAGFAADARRLIGEIAARGRHPLIVGGTMLYLKALVDGLHALPQATPALRAELDARAAQVGWPAMHAELARVDPATAARLQPADAQRIQRALEVFHASGRPLSAWQADAPRQAGLDLPVIALEPADRGWLHRRIGERFDTMLAAGLLDEVRRLRARGDLHAGLPAMRCVGYRQAWAALDAAETAGTAPDADALREAGVAATRQLAKRQLTWLRSLPKRRVVPCDAPDVVAQVEAIAASVWGPPPTADPPPAAPAPIGQDRPLC